MKSDSNRLKCIVIDDEPLAADLLEDYILKIPFLQLAGVFHNSMDALSEIRNISCDLVFLDIRMPELSGLKLAELLPQGCRIVFTTAYQDYALNGYELNASDYLVKPISFERFLKTANKIMDLLKGPGKLAPENGIASAQSAVDEVLFVKTDYQIVKIFLSEILYIEGLKEYIAIHTMTKKIITLQNMKKMEEVLPGNRFCRVHKSFIIALDKIDTISKNRVIIKNNFIPIGETYKDSFISYLKEKKLF